MYGLILRTCIVLLALAHGVGLHAAQSLPAQTSEQSGVTVKVAPKELAGDVWEFEVVFDTHTQPLADDVLKGAVLVTADGTQIAPIGWQGDAPGGHHRKGVLRFTALKPAPDTIHLRISRAGELKPRSFRWDRKR